MADFVGAANGASSGGNFPLPRSGTLDEAALPSWSASNPCKRNVAAVCPAGGSAYEAFSSASVRGRVSLVAVARRTDSVLWLRPQPSNRARTSATATPIIDTSHLSLTFVVDWMLIGIMFYGNLV